MSFKVHNPSKSIENIANTIGQDLERITDEIRRNRDDIKQHQEDSDDEYDEMHEAFNKMNDKVNSMILEVKHLRKEAEKNSQQIQILLEQTFKPIPHFRAPSTETEPYSSDRDYKPKHPVLKEVSSAKSYRA